MFRGKTFEDFSLHRTIWRLLGTSLCGYWGVFIRWICPEKIMRLGGGALKLSEYLCSPHNAIKFLNIALLIVTCVGNVCYFIFTADFIWVFYCKVLLAWSNYCDIYAYLLYTFRHVLFLWPKLIVISIWRTHLGLFTLLWKPTSAEIYTAANKVQAQKSEHRNVFCWWQAISPPFTVKKSMASQYVCFVLSSCYNTKHCNVFFL